MRKTFLKVSLVTCLALGASAAFTGCKDYDDDIDNLQQQIDDNKSKINDINNKIAAGAVITSVTPADNGVTVTLSDGKTFTITNGKDGATGATGAAGAPGTVWTIEKGSAGDYTWFCDGKDMGISAQGPQGPQGEQGKPGEPGKPGEAGAPGAPGETSAVVYYVPNAETGNFDKVTVDADGKETKEETSISFLAPGTITAVVDGDYLTLFNVKGGEGDKGIVKISLTGDLKGLVFVPQVYMAGVEAAIYNYVPEARAIQPNTANDNGVYATGTNENGVSVTVQSVNSYDPAVIAPWDQRPVKYLLKVKNTLTYELNPSNASIKDHKFALINAQKAVVSRAADPQPWASVDTVVRDTEGNNIVVSYTMVNPQYINGAHSLPENTENPTYKNTNTVIALTDTLPSGDVITSDYSAIKGNAQILKAIAFNTFSGGQKWYTTKQDDELDLYPVALATGEVATTDGALNNAASVKVAYNQTFDLASVLVVHATSENEEAHSISLTPAQLAAYGLEFQFTPVIYKTGDNNTQENLYGKISEAGKFTPCHVNASGASVENNGEDGISSVGRCPAYLVTLVETATGKVILNGYVKFEITDKSVAQAPIILQEADVLYACYRKVSTTWTQWTANVLEKLGLTKAQFNSNWNIETDNAGEPVVYILWNGKYVLPSSIRWWDNNANDWFYPFEYGVGKIKYNEDADQTTTNSVLVWTVDTKNEIARLHDFANPASLAVKFTNVNNHAQVQFIGITAKVKDRAAFDVTGYNPTYWVGDKTYKTMETNVPVPDAANDVTKYKVGLTQYWVNNKVAVTNANGYLFTNPNNGAEWFTVTPNFQFDGNQPTFVKDGAEYQLFTDKYNRDGSPAPGSELYCKVWKAGKVGSWDPDDVIADKQLIATLAADGKFVYNYQAAVADNVADMVLNLFKSTDTVNKTYANVLLTGSYSCGVPFDGSKNYDLRFMRPLNVSTTDGTTFIEAKNDGSSLSVGSFLTIKDWRANNNINDVIYQKTTGTGSAKKTEALAATYNDGKKFVPDYYQITAIKLDVDNTESDQTGVRKPLFGAKGVNPKASVTTNQTNNTVTELKINSTTAKVAGLNDFTVTYTNNGQTVQHDFNLYIPVEITYAWGVVKDEVKIPVSTTQAPK